MLKLPVVSGLVKSVSAEAALEGTIRKAKSVALQNGMAYRGSESPESNLFKC